MALRYPIEEVEEEIRIINVTIAKACYAERVLADDGDWYANQARKLPWQWAIDGGI